MYEIFAAYKYNAIHLIYNFDLANPEIFQNYLDQIFEVRDMSANIRQDVTVNADNRIVTLSTCVSGEKNMRYLVQGVLPVSYTHLLLWFILRTFKNFFLFVQ